MRSSTLSVAVAFAAATLSLVSTAGAAGEPQNLDFESGLIGWTKSGTAFDGQPTMGTAVTTDGADVVTVGGDYWKGLPYHPYGTSDLQPLMGGAGGDLASGGGAVQITSLVKVTVGKGGLINTNGMGGARGPGMDHGFNYGGAGSGGAILLEAPAVTMAGGLAANGGGRFDGGTSPGVGQAPGCDDPSLGGAGSVGDDPNGEAGSDQFCLGGGGAGWIAVRARACEFTGVVSPSLKSGCAHGFLMESK
jgi:hypothetical protein